MTESAAERAIRRNAEAGGARPQPESGPWDGFGKFLKAPNLALVRGSVFRPDRKAPLEVVVSIEWRGESWAVEAIRFASKSHDRLSNAGPNLHFLSATAAFEPLGRWNGQLYPGAAGTVVPSDGGPIVQGSESPTTREGTMAKTVVKKSGAKRAVKSTASAKATPTSTPTEAPKKARRTADDIAGLVPQFVKHLQGGGTMRQLKTEHGFSDDGPIRVALYRAGYDSKGNEHGEDAESIDASKAAGKKQVVALRSNEGAGWYRLAFLTGLSESEVKAIVNDAGGPTGRVYVAAEKPAKAAKSKADASATDAADTGGSRKATGRKVTRRAVKADPSSQG